MIPEALAAARLRAANERPYLAAALWSLIPVKSPGLNTMAVDRYYRLYYDEKRLSEWSVVEAAAVLIHEITHLLRDHPERAAEMQVENQPWFYATDIAINDDLVKEGLPLPGGPALVGADGKLTDGFLVPGTFGMQDGDIEEVYYATLMERADGQEGGLPNPHGTPQPGEGEGEGQSGGGQGQGEPGEGGGQGDQSGGGQPGEGEGDEQQQSGGGKGEGEGEGDSQEQQDDGGGGGDGESKPQQNPCGGSGDGGDQQQDQQQRPGDGDGQDQDSGQNQGEGEGKGQSQGNTGGGMCGSCAGGPQQPWEDDAPGEPNASDGLKPAEQKLVQRHVAQSVREAAKSRGTVPGEWKEWAEDVLVKRIPWQQELMGALRGAVSYASGMVDYTYQRPSRRQHSFPKIVLPAMRAPKPNGAFVIDTSGSMGTDDLGACYQQISDCIRQVGFPSGVPVLSVDARVQKVRRFTSGAGLDEMGVGRGGTDMRIGIDAALELKPKPGFIVVLTDGYTPWPETPIPGVKLIVVIIGNTRMADSAPSWARTITVEDVQVVGSRR